MIIHTINSVDLTGAWGKFWTVASQVITGPVETTLIVVGVALILFTLVKYLWDKRRGSGGKQSPIWWTLIFGGVLIAPSILMPLLLIILQWVINLGLKLVDSVWHV